MTSIVKGVSVAVALYVVTGVAQAADGVLLVQKMTTAGGTPQTQQIHIESKRMRAESVGPRGEKQTVIFDGSKQVLTIVDSERKTYTEMTKAEVDALGGMMAQVEQQLKSLPPEQRTQLEAMMKGRGMGAAAAAPKIQYKKVGTDTVGKWTCDKYEGYADGKKTADLCTVDPKVLGFSAADFAITRELADFFKKLLPASAAQMFSIGTPEDQGFSGIPVRSVVTTGGRQIASEITEVSRQTFADSLFQVPAGYQKQGFPGGGRGNP
jgi:hypothetical protein